MHAIAMVLAMVWMGVTFLLSQVLILREFLLVFQGNEFSVGIVLGSWLLLEAMGSALSGNRADRSGDPLAAFASVQAVLSLLLPLTILLIRTNRSLLGISPWEAVSYLEIWAVSLAVLTPLGLVNGAAFTYGCRLLAAGQEARWQVPGMVYALESLGAFAGGLAFTFLLVGRAQSIEIAFGVGAVTMGCVVLLLVSEGKGQSLPQASEKMPGTRTVFGGACLLLMVFFLVGVLSPFCDRVQQWATKQRWSPLAVLESADSIYGNITVLELGQQQMLYQNGIPTVTFPYPDTAALETLVHLPLLAHPDPQEVLVLGGGLGGALAEVLKHPVRVLYYTELDPLLIRMAEKHAGSSARKEMEDPRTRVVYEDGRSFLRRTQQRFDVVLVSLPDAATLQLNRFFTEEFFRLVRRHLEPGGLFALSMPGSSSYLSQEILRMNRCVWDTLEEVFPHVRALPGERIFFLASKEVPVDSLLPDLLAARLEKRGVETSVIRPYYLGFLMDPWQGRWLNEALRGTAEARPNQDLSPSLLYYTLAYKNAEVQPGLRRAFPSLERVRLWVLLAGLTALNLPFAVWVQRRRRERTPALSFAIFTAGFVGMAMEMVVILAFQSVYGYLYQWIGLLIAAFMAGLALGAFLLTRMLAGIRNGYGVFLLLECIQFGVVVVSAWGFSLLHGFLLEGAVMTDLPKAVLFGMNLVVGALVGCEFPLANREAGAGTKIGVSKVAGRLYALDLAGAWFGTLLVSVLLVPLIGIVSTLLFAAVLKACSLFYLYRSG